MADRGQRCRRAGGWLDQLRWIEHAGRAKAPCTGKSAILEGLFVRFVAIKLGFTVHEVVRDGDAPRSRVKLTGDPITKAGLGRLLGSDSIQFRDDRTASLVYQPDLRDGPTHRWLNPPGRKP